MEREKSENENITVSCDAALDIMIGAAYGDASDDEMRRLREHLLRCESCRAEYDKIKRLPGLVSECRVLPERDLVGAVMSRVRVEAAAKRRRKIVSVCAVAASFVLCATLVLSGYKMLVGSANKQYDAPSDLASSYTGAGGLLCELGISSADDVTAVKIAGDEEVTDREFVDKFVSALANMKSENGATESDRLPDGTDQGVHESMKNDPETTSEPAKPDTTITAGPGTTGAGVSDKNPPPNGIVAPSAPRPTKMVLTLRDGTSIEAECDAETGTVTIDGKVYDASTLTPEEFEIIFGNAQK